MNSSFYRIWLPISLLAHLVLALVLNVLPFGLPKLGRDWQLTEVEIVEAAQPVPPPIAEPVLPPVEDAVMPPVEPEPPRTAPETTTVPRGQQVERVTGITRGTDKGPGTGTASVETGPGHGPSAPPKVLTAPDGGPAVNPGIPGGTGTGGTSREPGGPSRGGYAKFGQKNGTDKIAGEINRAGDAIVLVSVSAAGEITDTTVMRGTGSDELDARAVRRVRALDYEPELKNGQPVAGTVRMRVSFDDNGQFTIEEVK